MIPVLYIAGRGGFTSTRTWMDSSSGYRVTSGHYVITTRANYWNANSARFHAQLAQRACGHRFYAMDFGTGDSYKMPLDWWPKDNDMLDDFRVPSECILGNQRYSFVSSRELARALGRSRTHLHRRDWPIPIPCPDCGRGWERFALSGRWPGIWQEVSVNAMLRMTRPDKSFGRFRRLHDVSRSFIPHAICWELTCRWRYAAHRGWYLPWVDPDRFELLCRMPQLRSELRNARSVLKKGMVSCPVRRHRLRPPLPLV